MPLRLRFRARLICKWICHGIYLSVSFPHEWSLQSWLSWLRFIHLRLFSASFESIFCLIEFFLVLSACFNFILYIYLYNIQWNDEQSVRKRKTTIVHIVYLCRSPYSDTFSRLQTNHYEMVTQNMWSKCWRWDIERRNEGENTMIFQRKKLKIVHLANASCFLKIWEKECAMCSDIVHTHTHAHWTTAKYNGVWRIDDFLA